MKYENFRKFQNTNSNFEVNETNKKLIIEEYDDIPDDIFIEALEKNKL